MDGHPIAERLPIATADDPSARLASLFDAHFDRLYRLARRLSLNTDDALDLVQETFLRAARSPASVPAGSASEEEAWLVRVLVNIRRDQWRKNRTRDHCSPPAPAEQNPETTLIAKTTVWQALDRLPPRRRAIVVMYELEGMSMDAIASLLGISTITVRWHLAAGRRDLARTLKSLLGESK